MGFADQKLRGIASGGGVRRCGEHTPSFGALCGQVEGTCLLRTLQAAVHQQRPLLMSYLTEKQIRKICVLLRQVGIGNVWALKEHMVLRIMEGRDEEHEGYAAAGGGSFD